MANRTGTYVAFDGLGEVDPTQSDFAYYSLMQAWNANGKIEFHFTNSHEKTDAVRDSSKRTTLERRICDRLSCSKNMVVVLTEKTRKTGSELSFEISKAVDFYKIPLILAYPDFKSILKPIELSPYWPNVLHERICNNTACAIHVPFDKTVLASAISQFGVNGRKLMGGLNYYSRETYEKWGMI